MTKVVSSINYTAPIDLYKREKPFYSNIPAPDGRQSNQQVLTYENIIFHDIREKLDEYRIDEQGFEIVKIEDQVPDGDFGSDSWIRENYYPVVERLLKDRFGEVEVLTFDHTVGSSIGFGFTRLND